MAIPVLDHAHQDVYLDAMEKWHDGTGLHLVDLERERFGYDHAAIGALMAESWELPVQVIHSIAAHHSYDPTSKADPAVQLVSRIKYFDEDTGVDAVIKAAENDFHIERQDIEDMIERSFSYAEQFAESFR